jgi:hypothetical protein
LTERRPKPERESPRTPNRAAAGTRGGREGLPAAAVSQSFRIVCSSCGQKLLGKLSPRIRCHSCGRIIEFGTADGVQPSHKSPEKRNPFEPGWRFFGTIVRHPEHGYAVATSNPSGFLPCRVEGKVRIAELVNDPRTFQVVDHKDGRLVLRPIGRRRNRMKFPAVAIRIDPARIAPRTLQLRIQQEGKSELEVLSSRDPVRAFERVTELANLKNDPLAWWLLAQGHRARALRRPIEQAIKQIGVMRFDRMIRQNPGTRRADWGPELLDFIDHEMAKLRQRRPGPRAALPSDLSAWDRPWWAD